MQDSPPALSVASNIRGRSDQELQKLSLRRFPGTTEMNKSQKYRFILKNGNKNIFFRESEEILANFSSHKSIPYRCQLSGSFKTKKFILCLRADNSLENILSLFRNNYSKNVRIKNYQNL